MKSGGDFLVWDGQRLLAKVVDYGSYCRVYREPGCTIGEFFAVLTILNGFGFNAR